jgi:hypothetical protein
MRSPGPIRLTGRPGSFPPESFHRSPLRDGLYCRGEAKDFGYKWAQASRGSNELVSNSRRLEEVALVGGAGDHRGRVDDLWPVFAHDRAHLSGAVRGVPLAVLLAADPQARVAALVYHGPYVRSVDTAGLAGDVLLLPQSLLPVLFLGPASNASCGAPRTTGASGRSSS